MTGCNHTHGGIAWTVPATSRPPLQIFQEKKAITIITTITTIMVGKATWIGMGLEGHGLYGRYEGTWEIYGANMGGDMKGEKQTAKTHKREKFRKNKKAVRGNESRDGRCEIRRGGYPLGAASPLKAVGVSIWLMTILCALGRARLEWFSSSASSFSATFSFLFFFLYTNEVSIYILIFFDCRPLLADCSPFCSPFWLKCKPAKTHEY